MNVELFYEAFIKMIEESEGVKIEYEIERRKETDGVQMCKWES